MNIKGLVIERGNRALVIYSANHGYKLVVSSTPIVGIELGQEVDVYGEPGVVEYLSQEFGDKSIDVIELGGILVV